MIKEKLLKLNIFSKLEDSELDEIIKISKVKKFNKDNIIFYEGEEAISFHFLLSGDIKLYKNDIKSNEIILHRFRSPLLFAEMPTFEQISFPATAKSLIDGTEILVIERENFLELLKNQNISYHIINSLTKKIRILETTINRNIIFDATSKVCSLLDENPTILKEFKNVEVALMLNMAPETLSRTLKKLREIEVIDNNGTILDSEKLKNFLNFC